MLKGVGLFRFYRADGHEVMALRDVDIAVAAGEIVAVVGASGSGKSTLLACLAGLDEPDGGNAFVGDERISHRSEAERCAIRARHLGILTQSGSVLDHLTVGENLRLQQAISGRGSSDLIEPLLAALGLSAYVDLMPRALSGGGLARAGLAAALSSDPPILLCDEPTAEVDEATEDAILAVLAERRTAGGTILVATHSIKVAAIADRVLHIVDGRMRDG